MSRGINGKTYKIEDTEVVVSGYDMDSPVSRVSMSGCPANWLAAVRVLVAAEDALYPLEQASRDRRYADWKHQDTPEQKKALTDANRRATRASNRLFEIEVALCQSGEWRI